MYSFSPNGKKLYNTYSGNILIQFDLCSEDTLEIQKSWKIVGIGEDNSSLLGLQIGPDNKIYIAGDYKDSISCIDNPNDNNITIKYKSISLGGKKSREQLPNFIESYFYQLNDSCRDRDTEFNNFLYIPNIFTPNNDGVNDNFSATISGYRNIEYSIYNRWGEKIISNSFSLSSDKEETIILWDGYIHKSPAPDGTYFYIIQLINKNNETETKKGFFQLLK